MLRLLLFPLLRTAAASLPVVCWHGVNDNADSCNGPLGAVAAVQPDIHTVRVMIGDSLQADTANSVLMRANDQVMNLLPV